MHNNQNDAKPVHIDIPSLMAVAGRAIEYKAKEEQGLVDPRDPLHR